MKHLLALMALCVAFAAGAQTGLVEFPYNPDADNDDVIGTADLLQLLALYGSEFSEESLYLSNDSTSGLYHVGAHSYYSCLQECKNLPGRWQISRAEDVFLFATDLLPTWGWNYVWLKTDFEEHLVGRVAGVNVNGAVQLHHQSGNGNFEGDVSNVKNCYCVTKERPKIEYTTCQGADEEFQSCCDATVSDGWYPLGGISLDQIGWTIQKQAFWRWAE